MSKRRFNPKSIDEAALSLQRDAEDYQDKIFLLELTDSDGYQLFVTLDGIMVGDLVADARDGGLPVEWPHADGINRHGCENGDHVSPVEKGHYQSRRCRRTSI